jgi:DNA-binding response OmpR family regulator
MSAIVEPTRRPDPLPKPETNICGMRVLVLDDDQLIVAALTRDLEDRGNLVFGYQSSSAAETALSNGLVVDAAVLDFDLREQQSGLEFIKRMAAKMNTDIPTVLLSGGTDSATLAVLAKSGRPWLTKPADPELIAATLGAILKSHKVSLNGFATELRANAGAG